MSSTYGGYAFKTGSTPSEGADAGFALLTQQVTLQASGTGANKNVDGSIQVPPGSQLISFTLDTTVAHTSGTAALTVGSAAGGAQYVPSTDVKAQGRAAPTLTTQLAAMQDVGSNTEVHFRLALGSTTTAVGTTLITVTYAQKR